MNSQTVNVSRTEEHSSNNRKADPPGKIAQVLGLIIVLVSFIAVGLAYTLGKTEEGQFHAEMSYFYMTGAKVMFEKQNNGAEIVANVSLDMGWERTPAFKGMGVEERRLVASFSYPDVEKTAAGAKTLQEQVLADVEILIGGEHPQSFSGISHTSFFTFVGNNINAFTPFIVLFGGLVAMLCFMAIGRKDILVHVCGCLMGITILLMAGMSYLTYSGYWTFIDIQTTEIIGQN